MNVITKPTAQVRLGDGRDYGAPGCYVLINEDTGQDLWIQTDWDWPGVASAFGFVPCDCGKTDGTVDCAHKTATEMIQAAGDWLHAHIGEVADDPGYFLEG